MVVTYPRACSSLASDEEIIPFPSDDATPPVTKMYFGFDSFIPYYKLKNILSHYTQQTKQMTVQPSSV
jgi:hypothetical protein